MIYSFFVFAIWYRCNIALTLAGMGYVRGKGFLTFYPPWKKLNDRTVLNRSDLFVNTTLSVTLERDNYNFDFMVAISQFIYCKEDLFGDLFV